MHTQVKRDIRVTVQWHAGSMLIGTCGCEGTSKCTTRLYAYIHFKKM